MTQRQDGVSRSRVPYRSLISVTMTVLTWKNQAILIYMADPQGIQQLYRVETVISGWHCYYCSCGPMSPEEEHCTDCDIRRTRRSPVNTQTSYHRVGATSDNPPSAAFSRLAVVDNQRVSRRGNRRVGQANAFRTRYVEGFDVRSVKELHIKTPDQLMQLQKRSSRGFCSQSRTAIECTSHCARTQH